MAASWIDQLPRHFLALTACVLAMLVGVAIADDYRIWVDTHQQREIGEATLRHLAGERGLNLLWYQWNKLYGAVFEAPLALIERILGREDSRRIHLSRYLLTHLFFLASGFAGYLLAQRMFGSRWLALFALGLYLANPPIYAHSFFNSKDVPFLAMFMICLWLAHRAFRPRPAPASSATVRTPIAPPQSGAFVLCGIAAGLLTNLRVLGLVFVAVVILMCLCDVVVAGGWRERRRAIASCALFFFASVATYYATMPYLWADPLERFTEILTVLSAHPNYVGEIFQGEKLVSFELPRSYLPIWFGITTPLLALALGIVGFVALLWRCGGNATGAASRPTNAMLARSLLRVAALLRNTPLRFELLVGACFVLPVLAVVVLQPILYTGWRQLYFLWAPFVLLAASGLRTLAEGAGGACRRFLPLEVPAAAVVAGLAALGLGAIAVEMIRMHPDQDKYFNVLATAPHTDLPLHQRYSQASVSAHRSLAYILEELATREEPDAVFNVNVNHRSAQWRDPLDITPHNRKLGLLSQRDRQRFKYDRNKDVDFIFLRIPYFSSLTSGVTPPVLYERRLYGEVIMQVATPDLSRVDTATAGAYRALYRDVTASVPAHSGEMDVYRSETAITWVKDPCPAGGVNRTQRMIVVPLDATHAEQRVHIHAYGVRVDDACLWRALLPEYAIAKILLFDGIGALVSDAWLEERRRRHAAITATPPTARATFDVYLEDGTLTYIKNPCVRADTEAPFFVHVVPLHRGDLPIYRRRAGMEALDFRFGASKRSWRTVAGDIFDGVCMATLELPDYPITNIGTGQYTPDGPLWRVDIGG